ncbi:MAG: 3-deoxy-manno-octulosonate cytidylyltransferase [Gemmatales bacterium]|nr:3-deoxy-manno-octulosonate cytidylyltransferase [Gemmatales bacterium]MCS7160573.1 3-deoxy-manno-octulosonate cytidylyltransferase [Gemmatales bacterium]MDW8175774.1 3-deoxy-manno-octulosonate cytidylyltransferase [Gemmatales bacterium]MDW8222436.1 3-deoxy-manno-octulosonate cytidylyltransferase [Gemmatales bacterium]
MKTVIVIPARYASQRLPAKVLLRETGKYLVQHVYERACLARRADRVLIATDDPRVEAAAQSFGAPVLRTSREHTCGTERVAEVARQIQAEVFVNLQGDEPLVEPSHLDYLIELLQRHRDCPLATLATPITCRQEYLDPSVVKVVLNDQGQALYFSRSPIPYVRDGEPNFTAAPTAFLRHLGLYAYRRECLLQWAATPPHPLETLEKLEQLRALALGVRIQVGLVAHAERGVDTWEDYRRFVSLFRQQTSRPMRQAA